MKKEPIESILQETLRREYKRRQPGMIRIIEDWLRRGLTPEEVGAIARAAGATTHVENVMTLIARDLSERGLDRTDHL
jgi:hypothetical protein